MERHSDLARRGVPRGSYHPSFTEICSALWDNIEDIFRSCSFPLVFLVADPYSLKIHVLQP